MTIEKEWTQEEIDNEYLKLQVNRLVTQQDLLSFYGLLFMTSNPRHYETWLQKADRLYEESQSIEILQLIGKVESLLEKIYASC